MFQVRIKEWVPGRICNLGGGIVFERLHQFSFIFFQLGKKSKLVRFYLNYIKNFTTEGMNEYKGVERSQLLLIAIRPWFRMVKRIF